MNKHVSNKKIVITGGHVTPAIAVIEILKIRGWQIKYYGRKTSIEGDKSQSFEFDSISKLSIPFKSLTTGRLQRYFTLNTLISLLKFPVGFFQSFFLLLSDRPDIILTFGSYVAVPTAICGWILRIPIVTHEQTFASGLANKFISLFANKICISWEVTKKYFPGKKTILTGNPLRKNLFLIKNKFDVSQKLPVIYITGGNQGAHSINILIEKLLLQLTAQFSVIHQCGNAREFKDLERLTELKKKLPLDLRNRYFPIKYIDDEHIGWVYQKADLMVTRAGANTITEIIHFKKPVIFIPLPWSGSQEQEKNADFLISKRAALKVEQNGLTPEELLKNIGKLFIQKGEFVKNLDLIKSEIIPHAAELVSQVVESIA